MSCDETPREIREPHRDYDPAKAAQRRHGWERSIANAREDGDRPNTGRRTDNLKWWN